MDNSTNNFLKEEVSLKEIFFLIKSQFRQLLFILCLSLLVALVYLIITRPIYTSTGSIIVEEENSTMSSIFDMGLGADMNYLENEIEVLKSRTTSERTINALLFSDYKNDLHLFNTKAYEDGFLRDLFRNILFLDWNRKPIINLNDEMNDSEY